MNLKNFKNINYTQKIITTLIIFVLICLFLYFIIFLPTIEDIISLRKDIVFQKIDMEKKMSQNKNMTKLSEKLKIIEPELDILDSVFINKNRELEFITSLEGIANNFNLDQTLNLSFDRSTSEQGYKKIPISISINGTIENAVNYLVELESLNYHININNIEINQRNNLSPNDTNTIINLTFNAYTYWQ